jgi:hypothetical protein
MKPIKDFAKLPKTLKTQTIRDVMGRRRAVVSYAKKKTEYTGAQKSISEIKGSKQYPDGTKGIFVHAVKGQKPKYFLERALVITENSFARTE